jgi:hypothetical protein
MLWRHNYNNFLKYDFILNRFFIKMHLFNFIRNNSSLEIPEFSGQKIKYYTIMNEDNHERMNFEGAVSLEIAQTTRNYYTVYHNENGQWHTANYYEKNQTGYKLLKVYYAIRYNNPEIRNLRIHTLDTNDNETIHLDRSFFYDYDDKNKVILWEKYLRLPGNEWETLYETWKFEWKDDKQITLSRVNIFTDDYLSSVFVAFHIKPFLIKSDHFAKQADYLESIGIGSGASTLFGGSISLFTPIFKCFFINIEISWDGMWKKIDDARYTLNIFSLTANAMYIIPFYQDIYAIGMYVGGGIGVASADYTQVYNLPAPNYLAKERASSSGIIFNIRLGFTIVWKDGIFGIGGIFFLGKLTDFKEGKGTLYYTPDKGLRVYDSNSAEAATATKAELNMYRFSFELFFGFRL